jgi:methionine synthase II (cobalamin-independent)
LIKRALFIFGFLKGGTEMATDFQANALPALIGSLPLTDHGEAVNLVLKYTPEIPLWVQLPSHKEEGMMVQFLSGMPGLVTCGEKTFINTEKETFESELLEFYEDYLSVADGGKDLSDSRFGLETSTAAGFFEFLRKLEKTDIQPVALKGQITGPVTMGIGIVDQNSRAIFYDERLLDAMVKLIALKARWQVQKLKKFGFPVILFFDEPALAGFGSSAFISISKEEISACFTEVIDAVHAEGGIAGIHVCANAEWSLILDSSADIVSFDAYSYFDKFVLYPEQIRKFMESGGILAWGIVPTLHAEDLEKETADSLTALWEERAKGIESLGIDPSVIIAQSLITPSCGTGSLSLDQAEKVLRMTNEVSRKIRSR